MQVPFYSLQAIQHTINDALLQKITGVINKADFILGSEVTAFEEEYAAFSGTKFCIGVGNGLDALKICLRCLDVGAGDEVIVPANTYIATILAVLETGAKPVLIEPEEAYYNITTKGIKAAITNHTKAVIPVHLYGQPCVMPDIMKVADKYKLHVIEDNAQAQGAYFKQQRTGSYGHINATSFYPSKNLGAMGDGGGITTNDKALADKARLYRNVGSNQKYHHQLAGYNSRLDTLQAAVLSCKLPYLDEWNDDRKKTAARYINNLKDCPVVTLPKTIEDADHVYHLFVVSCLMRDPLRQYLLKHDIHTLIHYPVAPHLQPALAQLGYKKGDFLITEELAQTCLSLPLFVGITNAQIDYVSEKIISFGEELRSNEQ